MDNKANKLLQDIIVSINNIDSYIGEEKIFETHNGHLMLQDAVERNIEIIGKAVAKIQ